KLLKIYKAKAKLYFKSNHAANLEGYEHALKYHCNFNKTSESVTERPTPLDMRDISYETAKQLFAKHFGPNRRSHVILTTNLTFILLALNDLSNHSLKERYLHILVR